MAILAGGVHSIGGAEAEGVIAQEMMEVPVDELPVESVVVGDEHGAARTVFRDPVLKPARELPMTSSLHKYRAWHRLKPVHESDSHNSSRKRRVRLFRNGRNQAIRIPRDLELEGDEALIRRDGDRLIIEPVRKGKLLALLASMKPITEPFPDVDENLGALDDISL